MLKSSLTHFGVVVYYFSSGLGWDFMGDILSRLLCLSVSFVTRPTGVKRGLPVQMFYSQSDRIGHTFKQWGTTKMEHGTLLRMQCIVFEDTKDPVYKTIVQRMMATYEAQGCKMSLKVHFLHSHIDSFPENLGAYSEEQVERFHQEFCDIDR
ncbi:hypothetical protein AVEN_52319-1 [Araneus ventricosus]|uniref:Uncharacterized protein n=1 Tax=Araneus ventricosus TaxID=182803 RepID=A0A4Y2NMN0_ARAVE|nr:hypothetical protein AVEN_52319-1 [Araneus ventricosus]